MNKQVTDFVGFSRTLDYLLASVAVRIQLSRTDHEAAVNHYQAISNHIDREGSPLKGRVQLLYPQGSMAIGATIGSKLSSDEFDIDIVAQLDLPQGISPKVVLDALYQAIKGEPGSRYYGVTTRRTRCVTVQYERMHLDVTPVVRVPGTPERESIIFHHRPEAPHEREESLAANPYGFADWFLAQLPMDESFAESYAGLTKSFELEMRKADQEPVPDQEDPQLKPLSLIALQLIKRFRNLRYHRRDGRRPPSIAIAKLIADAAGQASNLCGELMIQTHLMLEAFQDFDNSDQLIHIENPTCKDDVLTDRWPATLHEQRTFIRDLRFLLARLDTLNSGCSLDQMKTILSELFGETPTQAVIGKFITETEKNKKVGGLFVPKNKRLITPDAASAGALCMPGAAAIPRHTFFGD